MKNKHTPVMLEEVESFIPKNKKINVIDATFGGGGYSKKILSDFNVNNLLAIDRDPNARKVDKPKKIETTKKSKETLPKSATK